MNIKTILTTVVIAGVVPAVLIATPRRPENQRLATCCES